ncbi:unnamed protein product [Mytilus edulis]|uniref:C-type lectin domain-containing protein n=1 Tax=Mytilus edulis TaxID=6550 RepID=A0A8S3UPH0_MYTED|nr:unnamed protein product [Mytilus edulis]
MLIRALLVIFCCVSVIKSEKCYGKEEKLIVAGIRSALNALEGKLLVNVRKPQGCPAGWKEYNNHCYYFSTNKTTWFEAEKSLHKNYWMGAEDQLKEGEWRWVSDQSKVQYSGWSNGEPNNYGGNEDCVLFYLPCGFNWNDGLCHFLSGDPSALLSPKCTAHSQ